MRMDEKEKEQDHVAAFDLLFTTNQIQIMKILLPCFSPPIQKYLAIYIKYQELQYTLSYFQKHSLTTNSSFSKKPENIRKLFPAILPYCNDAQKKSMQQLEQLFSSFDSYREVMEMMQMLQSMSEDASGTDNNAAFPFSGKNGEVPDMDMLLSLLSPKQQGLMELLKGGISDERTQMDE